MTACINLYSAKRSKKVGDAFENHIIEKEAQLTALTIKTQNNAAPEARWVSWEWWARQGLNL
jgi:hypothetical protein